MNDRDLLRELAKQLEDWARESREGGWSTHQVEPMQRKAREIYEHLGRGESSSWVALKEAWTKTESFLRYGR